MEAFVVVISGLVGAAVGALGAFIVQSYYSARYQDIAHINDFIADLERIENYSVEYWLQSKGTNAEDRRKVSARVRGAIHATSMFYSFGPKLLANDWKKFEELDGRLFDAATGGDFESSDYEPDPARVVQIMECTNETRTLLRGARRKTFGAR